jgi:hypothetical protein
MNLGIWGRIQGTSDSREWKVFSMIIPETYHQRKSVQLAYEVRMIRPCPETDCSSDRLPVELPSAFTSLERTINFVDPRIG